MKRFVFVVVATLGCSHEPSTQKTPPPPRPPIDAAVPVHSEDAMTTPQVRVELEVQPVQITMARRQDVLVRMTVTNLGTTTEDFELGLSELKVDGEVSKAWNMSLNNSGHPKTWRALPPNERVSQAAAIGEELFGKPGDYTVELIVAGVAATPIKVHVAQ